jgi:hypothetical protein
MAKEIATKKEDIATESAPIATKEKVHKGAISDPVIYYRNKPLQSGGYENIPCAALIIGLCGVKQNMKPDDHAVNLVTWSENGYMEIKFNCRYSDVPANGQWGKK